MKVENRRKIEGVHGDGEVRQKHEVEEEEEEYTDIDTVIQICGTDQTMYG